MQDQTQYSQQQNPQPQDRFITSLMRSSEGRLLLLGVGLTLGYIAWLVIMLLVYPDWAQIIVGMTATNIMFGRAASMAFGYSLGLGHATVISVCIVVETIAVLICYPLFVFSWRHLLHFKRLKRFFERIHRSAETHKDIVQKYGLIGLFIFVWLPFWMTGPVVGCVIGFLLGLRTWQNITVVLAGTYVAIAGWALLLREFHERVASYSSYAAIILLAILFIIIYGGNRLYKRFKKKSHKNL
jgi:uncharacterized membrane protein